MKFKKEQIKKVKIKINNYQMNLKKIRQSVNVYTNIVNKVIENQQAENRVKKQADKLVRKTFEIRRFKMKQRTLLEETQ